MAAAHAPQDPHALSEPLTWPQIRERYPDQFVFLLDIDRPEGWSSGFRTARVAGAAKTRRDAIEQARPRRDGYHRFAFRFTGELTRPMADLLAPLAPPVPV